MFIKLKQLLFYQILLIGCLPIFVSAQSEGPNSAGTGTNIDLGANYPAWSNPGNINASDDNWATVALASGFSVSDALVATNFGFSIPGTATIDSIKVGIERSRSAGFALVTDYVVQLTKDGTNPVGTNQSNWIAFWPSTDAVRNYSDTSALWGTTWTPAEINSSNFGVYIEAIYIGGSVTGRIDHVTVTVYYSIPTPVELLSFDGGVINERIELRWTTTKEVNNDFYTIEKSANGMNYLNLATIDGKGSTELLSEYTFFDPLPFEGNNYYRLSQTDFDGTTEVFKPIMVRYDGESPIMKIYPNPVDNDYVNLIVNQDFLKGENYGSFILVRNPAGKIVYQQSIPINTLDEKIFLNQRFKSGVYILKLHAPYGSSSEKLVVK